MPPVLKQFCAGGRERAPLKNVVRYFSSMFNRFHECLRLYSAKDGNKNVAN